MNHAQNHYPLLGETPQGGLARRMRHVSGDHARGYDHRRQRVGHLWQGRYGGPGQAVDGVERGPRERRQLILLSRVDSRFLVDEPLETFGGKVGNGGAAVLELGGRRLRGRAWFKRRLQPAIGRLP
ncbi:MAG: hypothetical protein HYZ53_19445 [Planctomycetes bacterium]|nr:hypothetical protein [Planctomycetota bacterium]